MAPFFRAPLPLVMRIRKQGHSIVHLPGNLVLSGLDPYGRLQEVRSLSMELDVVWYVKTRMVLEKAGVIKPQSAGAEKYRTQST